MKVLLAAIGSRGDVQPFAHLAARFARGGHQVTLITHHTFAHLAPPEVTVVPVPSDPTSLMGGPAGSALRRTDLRLLNRTRDLFADFLHAADEPARTALPGTDVVVASTFALAVVDRAAQLRIPIVRGHMWPEYPRLNGPMPLLPYAWLLPSPVRRVARRALRGMEPYLGGLDGWWERGRLQLVAQHPVGFTTTTLGSLYAFSPAMLDSPVAGGEVTGWWTGDRETLSHDVATAVTGDDWIYVGFGSTGDSTRVLENLASVCERAGVRAVVQTGARGSPHPRILCVGDEPHDELFTRVRVAIHHGGAGTTGSVVRAGATSVVLPQFADQFYWGHRLHARGVAPRPLPRRLANRRSLSRLLRQALDPEMARRAGQLADRVRGEDGCARAVTQVEEWVAGEHQ